MSIKKRNFIAFFITCVLLAFTNQIWLVKKPVDVNFKLVGNQDVKIKVSLGSSKYAEKNINISKNNKLTFKINKKGSFHAVKINISELENLNDEIILSNVNLRNNKYRLNNLKKFKIEGANSTVKDNKLILKPTDSEIKIICKINGRSAISIEWEIFLSVLILSYLLILKLTTYLANLKDIKNVSKLDIVFLTIFFILLSIPISHINQNNKSIQENRKLAKKTQLIKKCGKLNLKYGQEFNEWFNDRFNCRPEAIRTDMLIKCVINSKSCKIGAVTFDKKHNLLYRDVNFWGMAPISEDKEDVLKAYVKNLSRLQDFCEKNHISLYFLIVPRACDYFDFDMPDKRKYMPNPADEVIDYLKVNTDLKIVYPKDAMKEANKETPVFFKTDHHWTKKGAYVGYYALMQEIKKDYSSIKTLEESSLEKYYDKRVSEWWDKKFNFGQTYKQMKLPRLYAKKVLDTPYLYYKNPEFSNLEKIDSEFIEYSRDVHFRYKKGTPEKILVIGDSFGCNLFEFLPYSFKDSLYLYNNTRGFTFKNYKPVIEKYKPNIIVILFYTPNVPKFLDLYPNKYSK